MSERASALIELAFEALNTKPGFIDRPDQRQLALLISDCIESKNSGAFEAPTGLGKSLAALVPAIVHAIESGKRTVVATYTNVLAEQYWRKDLPLAMSLFPSDMLPKTQFLIGRQRYACLVAMAELPKSEMAAYRNNAELGIEAELRVSGRKFGRELTDLWHKMAAPPVCPGRLCDRYQECYYYRARRGADKANIVITNHSLVIQDALLKKASDGELSMLGDYDLLLIDEAHDFAQAAQNSLEFELSEPKLGLMAAIAQRMQTAVQPLAFEAGHPGEWNTLCDGFRETLGNYQREMGAHVGELGTGILRATPAELFEHPQVKARATLGSGGFARELSDGTSEITLQFVSGAESLLNEWRKDGDISATQADDATDTIHNYCMYLREFAVGCHMLFAENDEEDYGVGVTYVASGFQRATMVRRDVIGLTEPLRELIWNKVPTVSLSATLAVDGNFDFYRRMTGAEPVFEEILPSPFDFNTQAALYLPSNGRIPDPTLARKNGTEDEYFDAVALEISQIISAADGRCLVLFHSKREMEAVHQRVVAAPEHPIYMQKGASVGWVGEQFKKEVHSTLFAVRSFWTGFDAPGETLSCVVLVRVPFEVPIDPPAVARMAWMQTQGLDPFASYSLPNAKMLIRQGAGRLIRTDSDCGVIALLDPRLRTKNYGEEILANMPKEMRAFDRIDEALAAAGVRSRTTA